MASYEWEDRQVEMFKFICEHTQRRRMDPLPEGVEPDDQFYQAIYSFGIPVERVREWYMEPVGGPKGSVRDSRGITTLTSLLNNGLGRGVIQYVAEYEACGRLQLTAQGLREANKRFGKLAAKPAPLPGESDDDGEDEVAEEDETIQPPPAKHGGGMKKGQSKRVTVQTQGAVSAVRVETGAKPAPIPGGA